MRAILSSFLRQTAFYFQILFKIHVRLIIHRYLHRCFRSAAQYYLHHDGRYGVRRYEVLFSTDYSTPNLDKLASQGMKFVNAYSAGTVCTPTRAAFMTGSYPGRTTVGLMEPLIASQKDLQVGLTPTVPSLATRMKSAGYATALIGKWHLGELC